MLKKIIAPAAVILTMSFTGCGVINNTTAPLDVPVKDSRLELLLGEWKIEDINNRGIIDNSYLTITFNEDGRVYGSASCNRYSSNYELTNENLVFSHSLVTKMACPEALMNQEQHFLEVLNEINQFDINENGALILKSQDGKTLRGYLLEQ